MTARPVRGLVRGRVLLGRVKARVRRPEPIPPPAIDRYPALRTYRASGFGEVKGWCHPETLSILAELTDLLDEAGVVGGSCEIGVYRGKLLIALHTLRSPGTRSLGIDLFEQQDLNIDRSGVGADGSVREILRTHCPEHDQVDLLARDSLDLDDAAVLDIGRSHGRFRWFSVDGGHTSTHAVNDIRLAQRLVAAGGVVAVDDYNNQDWPGVQEGVARLFLLDTPRVAPFCIAFGKLYLTTFSHQEHHVKGAERRLKQRGYKVRTVRMFGYDVVSARPGT